MKQATNILVLNLAAMMLAVSACAHEPSQDSDHISVVGVGEVEREPDMALLNISVTAQKPSLVEAKAEADRRYASVQKVIKKFGIDDKDVKVTRVNAQPQYEWRSNKQVYKGERVSRSLQVKVKDLDKVSPLMQAIVENGVSSVDNLSTGFQDRKALQTEALGAAADDARRKAKFLAQRLGRDLGAAYLITEHNRDAPQMARGAIKMARMSADSVESAPPEMFGTQKVQATVNVSFYLL